MKRKCLIKISCSFIYLVLTSGVSHSQDGIYNVKQMLEETGKSVLISTELQGLIDHCHAEGGGTIYFPAGDYLTGSLVLKDNTVLEISEGATLYGSMDINDYTNEGGKSLIYAKGSSNVGIKGKGSIQNFWV